MGLLSPNFPLQLPNIGMIRILVKKKQETEWHRIVARHVIAKIAFQDFKKGDLIYVEGSLHHKKYRNKQNVEMYNAEIHAKQIYPL